MHAMLQTLCQRDSGAYVLAGTTAARICMAARAAAAAAKQTELLQLLLLLLGLVLESWSYC
jgi:hypothetical protein